MTEQHVTISCGSIRLEGRLNEQTPGEKGVVITHPHPLYGGNMDNPVVSRIAAAFSDAGFTTLRFNFRGTGRSTGMFDNGAGEQDDVISALDFLQGRGVSRVWLAGYSFGSWVNAQVLASGRQVDDHVMVSPPAAFLSFDGVETLPSTGLIVTGARDDIAPPEMVRALVSRWGITPETVVLDGGDHFYSGSMDQMGRALSGYLSRS